MPTEDLSAAETIANDCLAVRARLLSRVVSGIYDEAMRELGITVSQMNILVVVSILGPIAPARVGERLQMEKSTVSRNLTRMRARGWLAVRPTDDARTSTLEISAKGRRLLERALPRWREAQGRARATLGDATADALTDTGDAFPVSRRGEAVPEESPVSEPTLAGGPAPDPTRAAPLDADALRTLCLEAGADDVGVIGLERAELDEYRAEILSYAPWAKSLVAFVGRMNREPVRSPMRSMSNLEFHHSGDEVNEVARRTVFALEQRGVRAVNPSMGFPMEMTRFPEGRIWIIPHKVVAEAAGLGKMGIHRNVIHPKFGNFILLGTIVTDVEIDAAGEAQPLDYNPCLECKLCVAACPVGAIGADGTFSFVSCYTHNYREFLGGFTDWVEQIAASGSRRAYREQVTASESASMWQSLSFGPNYKAAYCMAVCPAGEDVLPPFQADRAGFVADVVKPLQKKEETIYVLPKSDAEKHVQKRFPHKRVKRVGNGLKPATIAGFLRSLPWVFNREQAGDLDAVYHFTFTGDDPAEATVTIRNGSLDVASGHQDHASLRVTADSTTWLGFLRKDRNLAWALLTRRIRLRGSPRLLVAFGQCFPG